MKKPSLSLRIYDRTEDLACVRSVSSWLSKLTAIGEKDLSEVGGVEHLKPGQHTMEYLGAWRDWRRRS